MRASLRVSWLMAMLIAVLMVMAVRSGRAGCAGAGAGRCVLRLLVHRPAR